MAVKIQNPDAVIVGSGISGALIAKHLALAGKKVVILEAGEEQPPDINGYMDRFLNATAKFPESPYPPDQFADPATINAGRATTFASFEGNWNKPKISYLVQKGPLAFGSTYERINAGTVRHWLGTSLRNLPNDFVMKTKYDKFVDWPIRYEHLEPWYGLAEHEIGVSANKDQQDYLGIIFAPNYSYPMPGIPLSLVDEFVEKAMPGFKITGLGMDNIQWKIAPTPAGRNSQPYQNRRVCAGNTNCIPICPIQAKYDPTVTLADALRTGNVEIRYKTVASQVVVDGNGKVSGIDVITYDAERGPRTGTGRVTAKIYIIAGNAIETPRLLLMSKNDGRTAKGVANSSGLLGKRLMDHPLYLAWALAPNQIWGYRGPLATAGIEVARDGEFRRERGAFRIEIGNEGWNFAVGDPNTTTVDMINGLNKSALNPPTAPGAPPPALFGDALVKKLNDALSRQYRLGFLIEQSPEDNCSVTLSAEFTDHLGLPRPEIHYDLSDYSKEAIWVAKQTASAMFKAMNAQEFTTVPTPGDPAAFEWKGERLKYFGAGHLVGTYCMGPDKDHSVTDHMQRSWDHDNLYLVGSGTFPTVATANPTLTIAAVCLRTADHIAKNVLN